MHLPCVIPFDWSHFLIYFSSSFVDARRKLSDDYPKYCKSPRLSYLLSRYVREFLYTYRHLYKGFEQVCRPCNFFAHSVDVCLYFDGCILLLLLFVGQRLSSKGNETISHLH